MLEEWGEFEETTSEEEYEEDKDEEPMSKDEEANGKPTITTMSIETERIPNSDTVTDYNRLNSYNSRSLSALPFPRTTLRSIGHLGKKRSFS